MLRIQLHVLDIELDSRTSRRCDALHLTKTSFTGDFGCTWLVGGDLVAA